MAEYMKQPGVIGGGDMILRRPTVPEEQPVECVRLIMQKIRDCPTIKINGPEDAIKLMKEMGGYERERAVILHLSTKNHVLAVENISTGSLNASIVHPREAIKGAVLNSAAHVLFLHNHPSGDPQPSAEDLEINKKLQEAFDVVGIDLLDSIIIGRDTYYSAKASGTLFTDPKYKSELLKEGIIMEKFDDIDKIQGEVTEPDNCAIAMSAAMSVISEQCGGSVEEINEPAEGRFLRLHIKQQIKGIFELASNNDCKLARMKAENTVKQIELGVDNETMTPEYAASMKVAVQKALKKQ